MNEGTEIYVRRTLVIYVWYKGIKSRARVFPGNAINAILTGPHLALDAASSPPATQLN
jgi:hypothetical protein